jgi:hypothetical protein
MERQSSWFVATEKSGFERIIMTKEQLTALGLADDAADKVLALHKASIDGNYVTKDRFNTINAEAKQAKDSLKERDGQLDALKSAAGAADAMKQQITDLQTANLDKDKEHAAELKKLKREALDERLLTEAKAINATAVKPFLAEIDSGVDDEGYTALRKQHIEALSKADSTKFLFRAESEEKKFTGLSPGESGDGVMSSGGAGGNPFDAKSYDEAAQIVMFRNNPVAARAMAKQAGIPML